MTVSHFPLSFRPGLSDAAAAAPPSKSLQKGQQTRTAIVQAALGLATQIGLEGLSIGAVAEVMQMSKSGVFAHFGSREELQISVIREYHARFEAEVFTPALQIERGLPRLRALFQNWMRRTSVEIDSGCLYIGGAAEFDDRPGVVRDALEESVRAWLDAIGRSVVQAQTEGHLSTDADPQQLAFEIHGLILAVHYDARFLRRPGSAARANFGFDQILARYGAGQAPYSSMQTAGPAATGKLPRAAAVRKAKKAG
ncbi:MAG: TetR/AcrR family transcriptional regulator [Polaromonas sp.]|nr:TetR/AcrR family transcriptional regulator [Polaromonas sp.]